jgi:hypothetical protein
MSLENVNYIYKLEFLLFIKILVFLKFIFRILI